MDRHSYWEAKRLAQNYFLDPPKPDVIEQWKFYYQQLQIQPNDKILDVGCNTGESDRFLLDLYPSINKLVALDHSVERIETAKKIWGARRGSEKLEFIEGDGADLPFEKNTFDKVMCVEVLEWIVKPQQAIEEIYRVLKPKGLAIIIHSDYDTQVFTTKNFHLNRTIIHHYADSGPNGIIGRQLLGLCKSIGFTEVRPLVYTLINDKFEKPFYSRGVAHMMRDWILEGNRVSEKELDTWIEEMKELSSGNKFFYSINRNICVCQK